MEYSIGKYLTFQHPDNSALSVKVVRSTFTSKLIKIIEGPDGDGGLEVIDEEELVMMGIDEKQIKELQ